MAELEEVVPRNMKQQALCEECKLNPSKYKCPGCSVRSCSLPCVKAHKQRTGCTGKRQLTQFVPLSQFDDDILLSDYNMLEDVKRVAESAQRRRVKLCGYPSFRLPFHLKSLQAAAASRRTKILFHSRGMMKRETNRSLYNNRKKFITWTIEWRFQSTDVVLIDHGVHEDTNICSVIEKHLRPGPWNHKLRQFCEESLDSLKFFIRKYPKGPRSPFRELDIKAPIREQLANLVVLECPVIHVFLPWHSYDFEVIKDAIHYKPEPKESVSNDQQSPKGVTFREEEIEDSNSPDPQILDLLKHASDAVSSASHQKQGNDEKLNNMLGKQSYSKGTQNSKPVPENDACIHKTEVESTNCIFNIEELGALGCMDFDFEQGLIDAYSDLIAEANPDDFLDLEGVFPEEMVLKEDGSNHVGFNGDFSMEEELEEGEIPA